MSRKTECKGMVEGKKIAAGKISFYLKKIFNDTNAKLI
jgi:hypothetical protein